MSVQSSAAKKFQKSIKPTYVATMFIRVKPVNIDYFKAQAKKANISLSKYMDALFDSVRNA